VNRFFLLVAASTVSLLVACGGDARPNPNPPADDGGWSAPDAGAQLPDAGTQEPDAGTQEPDAGTQEPDAGTQEPDAGTQEPDAGTQEPDAGTQEPDAGTQEPELTTISPSDSRIQYTGRIDLSGSAPLFSHPGVSIKARFTGTTINVLMQDGGRGGAQGTNYYYVLIDERPPVKLQARPGQTVYEVADDLPPGEHTVELYKLTESEVGATRFQGFQIRGELLDAPPRPGRRLEVIGDSFACAYGNEAVLHPRPDNTLPAAGFNSVNQNYYHSFGAVAARMLDAEGMAVCYSGRGLHMNNTGDQEETMPRIYERTLPLEKEPRWDVRQQPPDVVVINLGVNDFANFKVGVPPAEDYQEALKAFVRQLRGYYRRAKIICSVGAMMSDWHPAGQKHWSTIQRYTARAVAELQSEGETEVYYLALSIQDIPYGEDWHPTIASHQKSATELAYFIRAITGW
jgi:hypothetical protein